MVQQAVAEALKTGICDLLPEFPAHTFCVVGALQAAWEIAAGALQALLDGLKEVKGEGPYNIELFGGGPADPNAPNFFKGAMSVLQPLIDDGTLTVVSGQTDFTQCATVDWDNAKATTLPTNTRAIITLIIFT